MKADVTASLPEEMPPTAARNPTPDFWRQTGQKIATDALSSADQAGTQIIAISSILQALYFNAVVFSDLRGLLSGWQIALYVVPVALWLLSLLNALLIFYPHKYSYNLNSYEECRSAYQAVGAHKWRYAKPAIAFLILGIIAIVPPLLIYLSTPAPESSIPVQIP